MSILKNSFDVLKGLSERLKKSKAQDAQDLKEFISKVENMDYSDITDIEINEELVGFLTELKKVTFVDFLSTKVEGDVTESNLFEQKIDYLLYQSLKEMSLLMELEGLRMKLNELQSKGRGRPKKGDSDRISVIKRRLEGDRLAVNVSLNSDALFANSIDRLAEKEGSYNKAYQRYADEVNADERNELTPRKEIKHVTVRRKYEKYKKANKK